ncbi:MAG TPA: 30S ribosome-binding factor RbfA [Solirubrobacterales bacterium]|nr:30S ribosome-binding factor RbfA [Solirubrobacterales bacterium]
MAGARMRRVNEVLREVVGGVVSGELADPRLGFVTVTGVETSPDLRSARVFVSVLGDSTERDATLDALRSSHGVIQSRIAAETRMKRTPTLTFHYDDTIEKGVRISRLLEETEESNDVERMVAELRAHDRFLLTAHEGPDGDALGSLLGMHRLLRKLGKDSVMFLAAKEFPLPIEYRFLPLEEVFHEAPADLADRVVVFLDCGNIDRMPVEFLIEGGKRKLNIDHHHDNTRFGDVDLVLPSASCTAEIVYDIACRLGVPIDAEMAIPLYVGLITDTGKFMYENTSGHTHRVAAELIEAGVDVDDTYRRLYEHVPIEKLRLVARALDGVERHCDDRLAISYISAADYAATGAGEEMTEGVIDHLRSIDGVKVAAVIRDLGNRGRAARKVSLRSSEGDVDVSAIARKQDGGGHKRAAGFSTDDDLPALVEFICGEVDAQLGS